MTNDEVKRFIAERVSQGVSLSKIQDELLAEKQVKMTFFELRMLASEIENTDWSKLDKPEPKPEPAAEEPVPAGDALPAEDEFAEPSAAEPAAEPAAEKKDGKLRGKTTVEISKVAMPGAALNGTVSFGSGTTAEWYLDQMGRIGFGKLQGGKPDEQDLQEFQDELRKMLGA